MKRLSVVIVLLIAISFGVWATGTVESEEGGAWKPTKPITIIVPWGAGGSTDQVTRVVAGELEGPLGQKVVIVNQPGASGSVGTKGALDAAHDGYTWAAGAAADLGAYKVKGLLDTTWDDWVLYLSVANVSVVAVNADSPYKDFAELLAAMKAKPGQIPVATAGQLSAGHNAMQAIVKYTGVQYKHVTYDGGNPAVIATVAGEAEVTTQLAVEEADMLKGGKLRALAVLDDKPLMLKGYGEIPAVTKWIPDFEAAPNYFGIWIPADAPKEVIDTFGMIWDTTIASSQALKDYANERGAVFNPSWGDEAVKAGMPYLQIIAWNYFDGGTATVSPDTVGIPKP
jgi:tripartite-type tricarboxylate transporter receptor subunit TctC